MRNMKTLIRLMGAVTLSTAAASSVVACGPAQAAELNGKYATLLGWYSADGKSIIEQDLSKDYTKIDLKESSSETVTKTSFKDKLLDIAAFKAKNDDTAAFLKELGFTSGSKDKDYSTDDLTAINALKATIKSSNPGKIAEKIDKKTDFKVGAGTFQVDIMDKTGDDAKVVKSYTVKTKEANPLGLNSKVITDLIKNKDGLNLTTTEGFEKNKPVSGFLLKLKAPDNQTKLDSLVKLLNTKVSTKFYNGGTGDTEVTGNFIASAKVYLQIIFGNISIETRIECDVPA